MTQCTRGLGCARSQSVSLQHRPRPSFILRCQLAMFAGLQTSTLAAAEDEGRGKQVYVARIV